VKTGPRGRAGIESILTQSGVSVGVAAFIGRGRDRAKVADLLAETRVVTLTGSGGCGKMRLAMVVSGDVAARFTDGVRWVDLQTVSEPGRVAPAVAGAVGVRSGSLVASVEAAWLFEVRARLVDSEFRVDDGNARALAETCRHLDGVPLAIELAAARVRVLMPRQIAAGLSDRFGLLTGGLRGAPHRDSQQHRAGSGHGSG
jgi:predicted ATPase